VFFFFLLSEKEKGIIERKKARKREKSLKNDGIKHCPENLSNI